MKIKILEEALKSERCIISVTGPHAGEGPADICIRKFKDIENIGKTFWLERSRGLEPIHVQRFCRDSPAFAFLVEPTEGGAGPAKRNDAANEYSSDNENWASIPNGMSPVTGRITKASKALVFDAMDTSVSETIDLWKYSVFLDEDNPLKFIQGCSAVCAIKKDMSMHPDRMKSRYRRIVAVAKLTEPYCVWLRKL